MVRRLMQAVLECILAANINNFFLFPYAEMTNVKTYHSQKHVSILPLKFKIASDDVQLSK